MSKDKIYLRHDWNKSSALSNNAKELCCLVNGKVIPALHELGLYSKEKVLYYAEDCERVFADYKAKNLQGVESLPEALQEMAREKVEDVLLRTLWDGWGTHFIDSRLLPFIVWKNGENGEQLGINNELLHEACNVYVEADEMEAYKAIQKACDILNKTTKGKCTDALNVIFCNNGAFMVSPDVQLKLYI